MNGVTSARDNHAFDDDDDNDVCSPHGADDDDRSAPSDGDDARAPDDRASRARGRRIRAVNVIGSESRHDGACGDDARGAGCGRDRRADTGDNLDWFLRQRQDHAVEPRVERGSREENRGD